MNTLPDWYLPYFPELRAQPPWVTEDMIAAEPALASIVDELAEPAAELASDIRRALAAGALVTVVGSGTSEYSARAVAEELEEARRAAGLGGLIESRESFEASLDPREGGTLIAVSHGGRSRSTVQALEAARARGGSTWLVTAASLDTPVGAAAEHHLVTPFADRSFCHTVGYLSPILLAAAVAAALTNRPVDAAALERHLEAARATDEQARAAAAGLHGASFYVSAGSGADTYAALELALKIEEAVRVPTAMRGLETLLHGHLVPAGEETGAIFLVTDRRHRERRAERTETALRAARRLGVRTAVIATPDAAERLGTDLASAGIIVVPDAAELPATLSSLTASALALQQLTIALVHEAGVNPDLIRREEEPYRDAAALTEAKIR